MTTSTDPEIVEGELVPVVDNDRPTPLNLFGSDDPDVVVAQAAKVAGALCEVINSQGLYVTIRGKKYVKVEGWTLLGTMLGVFPITVWSRKLEDGWEARVEARTLDGRVVGAAESMCTRAETRWRTADEYAIRSMAATRTTGKALRQPLGFVMPLAGFQETPAEEMTSQDEPQPAHSSHAAPIDPTREQWNEISRLLDRLAELRPGIDWKARAVELVGVPSRSLTGRMADELIGKLRATVEAAEEFETGGEDG
jgi:hypothetical protein